MNEFSIKHLELLTGIKAHTLRIWEQRYNIMLPKRRESNHRYYDDEDLKLALRISYLYNRGFKISKIAEMTLEDIKRLSLDAGHSNNYAEATVNHMLECCLELNEKKFEHLFDRTLADLGFDKCMLQVIYPFLDRIGTMWMIDDVVPVQEHFASNIIRRKIVVVLDQLPAKDTSDEVYLVFSPTDEFHEIPLLLMRYFLKKKGKRTVYFGPNVPISQLEYYAQHKRADVLYFHLITNLTNETTDEYLHKLVQVFPTKQIITSGPAAATVKKQWSNVRLLTSLDAYVSFANE